MEPLFFVVSIIAHRLLTRRASWHSKLAARYIPKVEQARWAIADVASEQRFTRVLDHFRECGYVVISGVLDDEEVESAMFKLWDYLETASRVTSSSSSSSSSLSRDSPSTWTRDSTPWPATVEGGILPYFSSGQSSAAWYIRSNEKIINIFRRFWGVDRVLTSFDGILVWRKSVKTETGWFHIDQNPTRKHSFSTLQGLVNLVPSSKTSGGNVLIETSHKDFPQHYENNPLYSPRLAELNGEDWLEIVSDDPILKRYKKERKIVQLELGKSDVLLWDSRTVHCSNSSTSKLKEGKVDRIERAAVLVSMIPEGRVSEECRKERRAAVDAGRTGSHWVDKVAVLGAEREEEAALERERHEGMKREGENLGVILSFSEMTEQMRELI